MRSSILGALALGALFSVGCSEECEISPDCEPGMLCRDNKCVDRPIILPGTRDGGPDAGPRDAGFRDGGFRDGGPDAGPRDGGDRDGGTDAGMRDAGFPDGAILGGRGTLRIQERTTGASSSDYVFVAELVDESNASIEEATNTFFDADGRTCELRVRRVVGGTVRPLLADRIVVQLGGGLADVTLEHDADGVYLPVPGTTFTRRMFERVDSPSVTILSGPGGPVYTDGPVPIPIPTEVRALVPAAGSTASLVTPLSWQIQPVEELVTVEVSDATREVVLTCQPLNDGGFTFPFDARQAYAATARTDPQIITLTRDRTATAQAIVPGEGYIPLTVRTSWGPVFTLTP